MSTFFMRPSEEKSMIHGEIWQMNPPRPLIWIEAVGFSGCGTDVTVQMLWKIKTTMTTFTK